MGSSSFPLFLRVPDAACAGSRRSEAAITTGRTWRSMHVPT